MWFVDVHLPCGKEIVFEQQERIVVCSHPPLLSRLQESGVLHIDGERYFPEDGEKFLEAVYDFYWMKGLHVEFL